MRTQSLKYTIAHGLVVSIVVIALTPLRHVLSQSQSPFLSSPYYGSKSINSYLDHEYPTYGKNSIFTRYDGSRWTNMSGCTLGINCYDGHDGYDFAMSYERVLAAASGIVSVSGWNVENCRYGDQCGYGLRAEIQHDNGYTTRYGHMSAVMTWGRRVSTGDVIGTSGNTGNSTGPHLHFGVFNTTTFRAYDPFGWQGGYADPWPGNWCMWADGQWANLCGGTSRPVVEPPAGPTQVVDDLDYNFTRNCSTYPCPYWNEASIGYGNHMWWTYVNGSMPDYWARWTPALPSPGRYEVYAYIPCANATTWQATYSLATTDGYWSAYVDQYGLCNQWVSLGTYPFRQGYNPEYNITLYDNTGNESQHCPNNNPPVCRLGVDALMFVRRGRSTYLPIVLRQ